MIESVSLTGDLESVKHLYGLGFPLSNYAFYNGSESGNLALCQWFHEKLDYRESDIIFGAMMSGNLQLCQLLHSNDYHIKDYDNVFWNGLFKWLFGDSYMDLQYF